MYTYICRRLDETVKRDGSTRRLVHAPRFVARCAKSSVTPCVGAPLPDTHEREAYLV